MNKIEMKWVTLDSTDGERTISQHCFKPKPVEYYGDEWIGNKSLCGKIFAGDGDRPNMLFEELEAENFTENNYCKTCKKIFDNLIAQGIAEEEQK